MKIKKKKEKKSLIVFILETFGETIILILSLWIY